MHACTGWLVGSVGLWVFDAAHAATAIERRVGEKPSSIDRWDVGWYVGWLGGVECSDSWQCRSVQYRAVDGGTVQTEGWGNTPRRWPDGWRLTDWLTAGRHRDSHTASRMAGSDPAPRATPTPYTNGNTNPEQHPPTNTNTPNTNGNSNSLVTDSATSLADSSDV